MLQTIKVWALRRCYRFISARAWRGETSGIHWGALEIPSPSGPIHGRLYNAGADRPLIVYLHGGGWVIGDLDTHHPFCLALSESAGCTLIAVDYRLAPEHPFPAATDDCLIAVHWIMAHLGDFGPCNSRLVVAGDSAGGNLTACTCLDLEEPLRQRLAGALILYPAVDRYDAGFASYVERATTQLLTSDLVRWFWDTYLGDRDRHSAGAERAFPLRSENLAVMPPTLLVTAEFDPLRDEGIAFAEKLRQAGVAVTYRHFDKAAHGFACSEGPGEAHRSLMRDITEWLAGLA
jgi:acetyl esterase